MKIGYMPDTHGGPYNQPEPTPEASAKFCDQLLNEGIAAEQTGFDGIFLPERHHRTETMFPPPPEADFTVDKLRKYLVMGSPKECIEQLEMWGDVAGADYVIMRFRLPLGPSPEQVLQCIKQFGAEVIPTFKK